MKEPDPLSRKEIAGLFGVGSFGAGLLVGSTSPSAPWPVTVMAIIMVGAAVTIMVREWQNL